MDRAAENAEGHTSFDGASGITGEETSAAGLKSIESVKGGEMLMEALDLAEAELADIQEFEAGMRAAEAVSAQETTAGGKPAPVRKAQRNSNPLLLGLCPHKYMLRSLRLVKAPDLEQALMVLPFSYVTRLISMLIEVRANLLSLLRF